MRRGGEFEVRQEIGANDIIQQLGDNRLEAGQTEEATVVLGFRATVKKGRPLRLTVGFTDDRGNAINVESDFVFV